MSETNVKTVKKIKKVVSEPNFIGVDLSKGNDVGTCNGEITPKVIKKVKKIIKDESTVKSNVVDDSPCNFSDFESGKIEAPTSANVLTVKKVKKCVVEKVDESELIKFVRVTELNDKREEYAKYFPKDKYKYGMVFYDFEIFKFATIATFVDVINCKETIIVNDRKAFLKFYMEHRNEIFSGYNSRQYDTTIYKAIILGLNPKEVNDKLISGLKAFQISDKFKEIQFYDFDNYKLNHSLKQLESGLSNSIYESKIPFDLDRPLTMDEIEETISYNKSDVYNTIEVHEKGQNKVYEGNISLIEMYKFPISDINKTQAQLTAKITDCEKPKEPRNDDWDIWVVDTVRLNRYKFVADWFMSLRNDHDRPRIETYENGKFVPYKGKGGTKKEGYELHIDVCGIPCVFAMGGAHGAPDKPIIVDKFEGVFHSDLNSMYPSIMLEYDLLTRNSKKPHEFRNAYNLRIQYKKEGNFLNKVLKIPLNAQYGCMGDINSSAYDLRNCRMVCITGQLLILSLLDDLQPYISLKNLNTDGIIYTINKDEDTELVMNLIKDFEVRSHLTFTTDLINSMVQRDVNNYVFNFANGDIECKGASVKYNNPLDNDLPILNECTREYIIHKINVEDYINNCDELWKFMKTFKLGGTYEAVYHNGEKLNGKCNRVFASKNLKDTYLGKKKADSNTIEKFAGQSDHVFLENGDIHGKKCSEYPMLDKQWYIEQVYDRLKSFGIDARPSLFEEFF